MAETTPRNLPEGVARILDEFLNAARAALGDALRSAVLYGSAAEGRLRATSDVNLILVLSRFEAGGVDPLREPLRVAQATIRLAPMFLLEPEVKLAASAFAAKFADIRRRRRVLFGPDPFADLDVPRDAAVFRLRQVLLNLILRLRFLYAARSLREEQMALVVADAAAPLRSAASALRELQGEQALPPKESLEAAAMGLGGDGFRETLAHLSEARETRRLPPGVAGPTALRLVSLAEALRSRAEAIR